MINGEIKIMFDEGSNITEVAGKSIPYIGVTRVYYEKTGNQTERKELR